jgi:hypothetical protein
MDKKQIKETVHGVADKAAEACKENVKTASGWSKWLWTIAAIAAGAAAWFTQGCTPANVEQLQAAHAIYHVVSGKPCKFSPEVARSVK